MMRQFGWTVGVALVVAAKAVAAPIAFDFKDPKGVNTATFHLDAPLEAIRGSANGISGTVQFDPADPAATKGRIVVDAASMQVPNPVMQQHMHAKDWMDVATHPTLSFEVDSLSSVSTSGDVTTAEASGKMTIKGVARTVKVPIKLTFLKDKLGARTNGRMQGDLLVVRAQFTIRRSDFGINPGAPTDKVADEIEISLSVAGSAPRGS